MRNVHIHAPQETSLSYRVLPKGCQKFTEGKYASWRVALEDGRAHHREGFRVFAQRAYEWYDPTNTELIKVSAELSKESPDD